jgi:two-component system, NtrC family, nitrogen regulation sensor histidine kinase NtrY
MDSDPRQGSGSHHDRRVFLLALLAGLPAVVLSLWLLSRSGFSSRASWTLGPFILICWLGFAYSARQRVVRPLRTLANLLAGLREGDFSSRARGADTRDPLGTVIGEINALGDTLQEQRVGALEATALLRRVMGEIDVAVFAFDDADTLVLINRAGERLLGRPGERAYGLSAEQLGLAPFLAGEAPRVVEAMLPGGAGRWEIRRGTFRQHSRPHQLLVVADLSRALREEERLAWQRLVRVLSHEINNSLAPIKSLAGSLGDLVERQPPPADRDEDLQRGLGVIESRAEALSRFMASYARLARLPQPRMATVNVEDWVRRAASLESRLRIQVEPGPTTTITADGDQLDQLLINLIKNAADAVVDRGGTVTVNWSRSPSQLEVRVLDDGPGLAGTTNLFVPFFTTKPNGSGIGLALSRQIAEAHGGTLALANRAGSPGCEALLRLPL